MEERSVPVIDLSQSNLTGGNFFMPLDTGKRIHSNSWKEVPTDKKIIALLNEWAEKEIKHSL